MKKLIVLVLAMTFCVGCYIPYPSSGRRTLQPYESWQEVCTTKVKKDGAREKRCKWVRSR
jgi:hypothetical protein